MNERAPDSRSRSDRTHPNAANQMVIGYMIAMLGNLALWALALLAVNEPAEWLYATLSTPIGVSIIVFSIRSGLPLLNPLTLYSIVWMVLVPLTAFEVPLMGAMNSTEVAICAGAGALFCAAGAAVGVTELQRRDRHGGSVDQVKLRQIPEFRARIRRAANVLILISVVALVANTAIEGRFALFDVDSSERKAIAQFVGYPLLSSLGTIALAIFAWLGRVSLAQSGLIVAFIGLQLLTAQRWVAIVGLLLAMVVLASTGSMSRRQVRRMTALVLTVVAAFSAVALFRGGSADQERYFILTGRYNGDPAILQATEIVRYFGMSQRNMTEVLGRPYDPSAALSYSLSPFYSLWSEVPTGLGTSVNGYTANNVIAYFYTDVGLWWPALVALFSLLINLAYWRSRRADSFASTFTWAVCALGLITSFFAYVNAYAYWVALFPVIALGIQVWAAAAVRGKSVATADPRQQSAGLRGKS